MEEGLAWFISVFGPPLRPNGAPTFEDVLARGTTEYEAKRFTTAIKCLEICLAFKPPHEHRGAALHLLANCQLKLGKIPLARQCFLGMTIRYS